MSTVKNRVLSLAAGTAFGAMALALAAPAQAIVPNDNFTPADIIDDTGVNGIGMFFRNDGFVCSGTLINPRTVLFAAHCVNDRPESDYQTGGVVSSAFSFDDNALPGFQYWIANGFASNPDLYVYNIGQIQYNPRSLEDPNAFGFLEGDVAVAALSDPANNVPTWAILFSPLPSPTQTLTDGTGYHVNITGYGRSGSGTNGSTQGIDWRRRAAENMLGALTSFDERNQFLFGDPFGDLPQSLYRLDFDDPNETNEFDFNLYQDEARVREGTTAGGDSGGPLILDAANNSLSNENLVLAVLSGGSRFFGPQVFSSYGTESFYQPLYLFWDYIAEVNPYRYVSSVAGDGAWEDPNHWVSELDPAYRIIDANGNVINGIPTSPGASVDGGSPDFGVICFDERGDNPDDECQDLATGDPAPTARNGTGAALGAELAVSDADQRERLTLGGDQAAPATGGTAPQASDGGPPEFADAPLPTPTIENGLPGATGFVPNNIDPDPSTGRRARYFDVMLGEAGTTRLNSRNYEIDRLSVTGDARLVITKHADLTVLGDFTQTGGIVDVDGRLTTGEALLVNGQFRGRGVFDPTFFTVVAGTINPDGNNLGTLTVRGDVILSSGATTIFDIVRNRNDRINVKGDADNPGYFIAGGTAAFRMGTGAAPRDGQTFSIVSAERVIGEFDNVVGSIGVLNPVVSYDTTRIRVTLEAGSLAAFIGSSATPAAVSFASALDQLRTNDYNSLYGVYGAIDVMDPGSLSATLAGFAPNIRNETMAIGNLQSEQMLTLVSDRLSMLGSDRAQRGTFNVVGSPEALGIAAGNSSISTSAANQRSFAGRIVSEGRTYGTLPDTMSGFISGGYELGRTATSFGGSNDTRTNWHMAMGLEAELSDALTVGGASAMSNSQSSLNGSAARVRSNQAMAYASYQLGGGAYVAGLGSASISDIQTERLSDSGYETARFNNDTQARHYSLGAEAGVNVDIGRDFSLTPRAALRFTRAEVDGYAEAGSEIALQVDNVREQRIEGRVGIAFQGETTVGDGWTLRPQLTADYVHALGGNNSEMTVRFANASGVPIVLPGFANDGAWAEMRGGLSLERGNLTLTTAFETDVSRADRRDDRAVAEMMFRF